MSLLKFHWLYSRYPMLCELAVTGGHREGGGPGTFGLGTSPPPPTVSCRSVPCSKSGRALLTGPVFPPKSP
eukprot:767245-Hanusia_phi.AAC.7